MSWSLSPTVLLPLALWLALYLYRFNSVRRSSKLQAKSAALIYFCAGFLAILTALVSPLDHLAERSFTFHMAQHLLLADIGPLLLLLGLTRAILRPATKRLVTFEKMLGPLASPAAALVVWLAVVYVWHLPTLYEAALNGEAVHALEHASFLTAGLIFWWPLVSPVPMRRRLSSTGSLAYIATAKIGLGLLGLYLVWIPTVIYPHYIAADRLFGFTAIEDQSTGGMLMMVEQSLVLAVAFVVFFISMLAKSERDQLRREAAAASNYGVDS